MATLSENLQSIYTIKNQIKEAIGTDSDVFADYPAMISSGGGEQIDPLWGDAFDLLDEIQNYEEPVTCDDEVLDAPVFSDFEYEEENGEVTSASWKFSVNVDGTDYTIKVVVDSDNNLYGVSTGELGNAPGLADRLDEFPELYDDIICPCITNFTFTQSDDPQTDEYDYLIEGNLYGWNFRNCIDVVEEITENGFYPNISQVGFNVNVASDANILSEVFGADENDERVYIPFDDEGDKYTYTFSFNWDGENWRGDSVGFSLVGRLGNATQYDYDDQQDEYVLHNSYTALQMHVANGSFYLGDYIGSLEPEYDPEDPETLIPTTGGIDIATDLYPNTKFLNNGFGASPDNLDMSAWEYGTLDFYLIVPKNLVVNYGSGVDTIEDGTARYITHPLVTLNWEWSGELVPETFTCPNCGAEIDHEPVSGDPCPDCGYPDNEEPEEEPEE